MISDDGLPWVLFEQASVKYFSLEKVSIYDQPGTNTTTPRIDTALHDVEIRRP